MFRMNQLSVAIRPAFADPAIDASLAALDGRDAGAWSIRFTQGEESYILLPREISIQSFPVHHDVRQRQPGPEYLAALRAFVSELSAALPSALAGLGYFFDPAEITRPCFFKVYEAGQRLYLYLLRLDMGYRPQHALAARRGDNDFTAAFSTRKLFFESDIIPLDGVEAEGGRASAFLVRQLISQTWIGETGKGYMVRGIWMDMDLSKFFSRLFLPAGRSLHPYYPLACKYKTICHACLAMSPEGRKASLVPYARALAFLGPAIPEIQAALRGRTFSESIPEFTALRARVPAEWTQAWSRIRLRPYLNENDQKEYLVEA